MFPRASIRYNSSIAKLATTPNKFNAKSSGFNLKPDLPNGLFFHPAPAGLNPEITPKAFLPESDARAKSDLYYPEQDTLISKNVSYMPIISKTATPKHYNLDSQVVGELQAMRDAGATRKQMKEKFNVTDNFISLTTRPNEKTLQRQSKLLKKAAKNWSAKTLKARKARETRKLEWERDL